MTARFKWSQTTLDERLAQGQRLAFKTSTFTTMYYYLDDDDKFIAPSDLLSKDECGVLRNDEGHAELKSLFDEEAVFSYPKPTSLVKFLVRMVDDQDAICMDFFAGSGTTADAVFQQNVEDGGKRRFLLVQLPEPLNSEAGTFLGESTSIAEITKERIRRAALAIDNENAADLGFRSFHLASSNIHSWNEASIGDLLAFRDSCVKGRTSDDLLYELLIKQGMDLCELKEVRDVDNDELHIVGLGAFVAYFSDAISTNAVETIASIKDEFKPEFMRVVFRDSGFKDDVAKTNAIQILRQRGIEDVKTI